MDFFAEGDADSRGQNQVIALDAGDWIADVPVADGDLPGEPASDCRGGRRVQSHSKLSEVADIGKQV